MINIKYTVLLFVQYLEDKSSANYKFKMTMN